MSSTSQLSEVNLIRPIVIVLLVVMHSFTLYTGIPGENREVWGYPNGISPVEAYSWITKISFSFMLEMFVFISGYLFAYQSERRSRSHTLTSLIRLKFKRLIIPSIVFSLLYSLLFYTKRFSWPQYTYDILNGLGHMWFLPMLFWCFILTYLYRKVELSEDLKLAMLFVLSIFSAVPLPFQLSQTCYYLFFFYLGGYVLTHKDKLSNYADIKHIILWGGVFVILFIPLTLYRDQLARYETADLLGKIYKISLRNLCKLGYATTGVFTFYLWSLYITKRHNIPQKLVKINGACFGIYLFQQFILLILYYNTPLPQIVGTYWLPWVGLFITLPVSLLLSRALLKTSAGRLLIA
ncbi:acyltransferase [Parabacteroides johnsonii]|uniref:acyltransferase n=1 Tax=Parabacteroides johnsonii TaxID=387661 RepID=UPI0031F03B5B